MVARYQCALYDQDGERVAILSDWRSLSYERRLNNWGEFTISLPTDDDKRLLFELDGTLHVFRRDLDVPTAWYEDYNGFVRTPELSLSERDLRLATFYGRGPEDLLRRRCVLFNADAPLPHYNVKQGPGETVMKEYVAENMGPSAYPFGNGRYLDGRYPNFVVAPDLAAGTQWSGASGSKTILELAQEISLTTGVDFWIEQNDPVDPAAGYVFRTAATRGVDHTVGNPDSNPQVVFTPQRGDIIAPNYVYSRTEEITEVIIEGVKPSGGFSVVQIALSPRRTDSPYNAAEAFKKANVPNANNDAIFLSQMQVQADLELAKLAPRRAMRFRVLQTPSQIYGVHYDLGDSVTVVFEGTRVDLRIISIRIHVAEGKESIEITTADSALPIPNTVEEALLLGVANLAARIRALENKQ